MSLRVDKLNCAYGSKAILKDISLEAVPRGQLSALTGPNAAGKSTLFKSLAGLVPASANSLSLDGQALSQLSQAERFAKVCYMPQGFSSNAALTVFEAVLLAHKQLSGWRVNEADIEAVAAALDYLGIGQLAGRYIGELSGGQQQLVSLCQALSRNADILLLDEPTSALDLQRQLQVLTLLQQHCRQHNSVCIVSIHDLSLAARFAEHLLVLRDGQLISAGETDTIMQSGAIERCYDVEIELLRCRQQTPVVAAHLRSG